MYLRTIHAENSTKALLEFIHKNPLGVLTTAIRSPNHPFLQSSHIPWILDETASDDPDASIKGILRGHIARQNPQSKAIIESFNAEDAQKTQHLQDDIMILFTGNHHHYITPKFYTETKPSTGKVVPTWNYAAVQVYGKAKIYHEVSSQQTIDFLKQQIHDLTQLCETSVMGYTSEEGKKKPWEVTDAPERYVDILRKNIIGIEVSIESIGGKFKMSQEMGEGDRRGVMEGFDELGTETGCNMARLVAERGELKDAEKRAAARGTGKDV